MPKGNPNTGDKRVHGVLKVYDAVTKAYRPSYIAPDATATVQGDVLLSDSVASTDDAATGITAATPKAVKEVNDNANTKLSMTETAEQTVAGPVVFGDSLTVEGESTFNEKVTFDKGISIPGGVTLEGDVTGNADTATKLKTAVNINTKSGTQTESTKVSFDGSKDITLPLGDIDASAIKGVLSLDNIPQSAIERVVNYESLDAAFDDYLAAPDNDKPFQAGDTIRVPDAEGDTAEMYAIVGDPAVKNNYVKYAASIASEALEADHAKVADKINIADIADGSAMCVIDKVLKKSGATVGGEYKPMYLHNGTFKETAFTIKTNVPADAKFTDTTYTDFTPATETEEGTIERGRAGLVPAPTTKDAKFLKNDGTWADVPSNWDELADKPLTYNGAIQDVGVEDGKFYVEALFTSIGEVEFDAQLQVLSAAGNQLKLTSAVYKPTEDGTTSHKFVIEPPTGQDIADIKIVSAGIYYDSITLLDEVKSDRVLPNDLNISNGNIFDCNIGRSDINQDENKYYVDAYVNSNVEGTYYLSCNYTNSHNVQINFDSSMENNSSQSGLYPGRKQYKVPVPKIDNGNELINIELMIQTPRAFYYTLDKWILAEHQEISHVNSGKIVEVTDSWNDPDTHYDIEYVINTNYDYTKYLILVEYATENASDNHIYESYHTREKNKNLIYGTVKVSKTKTKDDKTYKVIKIELNEQATTGNDITLDVWYPEKEVSSGVSSYKDLTNLPKSTTGYIKQYWTEGTNPSYYVTANIAPFREDAIYYAAINFFGDDSSIGTLTTEVEVNSLKNFEATFVLDNSKLPSTLGWNEYIVNNIKLFVKYPDDAHSVYQLDEKSYIDEYQNPLGHITGWNKISNTEYTVRAHVFNPYNQYGKIDWKCIIYFTYGHSFIIQDWQINALDELEFTSNLIPIDYGSSQVEKIELYCDNQPVDSVKTIDNYSITAEIIDVRVGLDTNTNKTRYMVDTVVTVGTEARSPVRVEAYDTNGNTINFYYKPISTLIKGATQKVTFMSETEGSNLQAEDIQSVSLNIDAWNGETGAEPTIATWEKPLAEVAIDNSTITKNTDGELQVNGFGVIGKYWNTGSGLNLRTNPLYFKESNVEANDNWPNTYSMLDLRVDEKTLKASSNLPLQVWTRPVMYGGSGLIDTSTWYNPNTSEEETVDGLHVNTGLGLMINPDNKVALDPQHGPYIKMSNLVWGDTPNGRGINYTLEGRIPRVNENDSGNFDLGIAIVITQPGNGNYKWTRFYPGTFDETTKCYNVSAKPSASGFVGLDSNGGNNAWFTGSYDQTKPIDINIFAADLDDPNQGSFIVFSGLNQSYFNITDYDNTHNLYRYFTADYSCYEIIDTLSATTDPSVKLKMMGWYEEFAGWNAPIKLHVKNIDGTWLTSPIEVKHIDWTPGTYRDPHREVFGTSSSDTNGIFILTKTDLTANSITNAPSEYILVVATDKNGKELWAQKIDMPLTYLDPADAAQLVQDALATN